MISTATVFWNSSVWLILGYGQKSKLVKTLTYSERFDLLSRMVILMFTVAAWLGDRGIGYMCVWVGGCLWLASHVQLQLNHVSDSPCLLAENWYL